MAASTVKQATCRVPRLTGGFTLRAPKTIRPPELLQELLARCLGGKPLVEVLESLRIVDAANWSFPFHARTVRRKTTGVKWIPPIALYAEVNNGVACHLGCVTV